MRWVHVVCGLVGVCACLWVRVISLFLLPGAVQTGCSVSPVSHRDRQENIGLFYWFPNQVQSPCFCLTFTRLTTRYGNSRKSWTAPNCYHGIMRSSLCMNNHDMDKKWQHSSFRCLWMPSVEESSVLKVWSQVSTEVKFRFKRQLPETMSHEVFRKQQQCVLPHLIFLSGLRRGGGAQTCQAQKRPAWASGCERSRDKYGPLIHSLTLASISLYLSAIVVP